MPKNSCAHARQGLWPQPHDRDRRSSRGLATCPTMTVLHCRGTV